MKGALIWKLAKKRGCVGPHADLAVVEFRPSNGIRLATKVISYVRDGTSFASYVQIAATLYISRNTVKTHLRSIYQKLGGASRSEAIERAVELRLL